MHAVPLDHLDHAWLRSRLAAGRRPPSLIEGDYRPADQRTGYRRAAVLIPLVERPGGASVLLTRRTTHLRNHGGQIAFPGGRVEPEDASVEQAALREAREEIGLDSRQVEVLGTLDDYTTATSFRVTPVVGLLPGSLRLAELVPDSHEVADVFEVPLAHLLDAGNWQRNFIRQAGRSHGYYAIPYGEHYIWGATAAMLVNFTHYLREAGSA